MKAIKKLVTQKSSTFYVFFIFYFLPLCSTVALPQTRFEIMPIGRVGPFFWFNTDNNRSIAAEHKLNPSSLKGGIELPHQGCRGSEEPVCCSSLRSFFRK